MIVPSPRASIHTAHGNAEQVRHPLRDNLTTAVQLCGHASKPASLTKALHALERTWSLPAWTSLLAVPDWYRHTLTVSLKGTCSAIWVEVKYFLNVYPKTLLT